MRRQQVHRWTFIIAGIYNLCWGAYAGIDPQGFFRMAGMAPTPYPQIFACLGMVIGVYGLLYWEVARAPERGWLIAAIGLLGKVLGPIGMVWMVGTNQWPPVPCGSAPSMISSGGSPLVCIFGTPGLISGTTSTAPINR